MLTTEQGRPTFFPSFLYSKEVSLSMSHLDNMYYVTDDENNKIDVQTCLINVLTVASSNMTITNGNEELHKASQ